MTLGLDFNSSTVVFKSLIMFSCLLSWAFWRSIIACICCCLSTDFDNASLSSLISDFSLGKSSIGTAPALILRISSFFNKVLNCPSLRSYLMSYKSTYGFAIISPTYFWLSFEQKASIMSLSPSVEKLNLSPRDCTFASLTFTISESISFFFNGNKINYLHKLMGWIYTN